MNALLAIDSAIQAERRLTLREIDELHRARAAIAELIEAANAVVGNTPPAGQTGHIDYCDGLKMLINAVERIGGGV